jgi:hypothetical protein
VKTIATTKIEEVENDNNLRLWRSIKHAMMRRHVLLTHVLAFGLLFMALLVPVRQTAHAQGNTPKDFVPPVVFQAAGPTADSIQTTVDAFRDALGDPNGNNPPPLDRSGRREINWDGANPPNVLDTTPPVTPFNTFLNTRGSQFTTPGIGLSQAPLSGGPPGWPCRALPQSDLRHHLQHLQPVAVVHSSGQQYHRSFVFFTRHQWRGSSSGEGIRRGLHRRRPAGWERTWEEEGKS